MTILTLEALAVLDAIDRKGSFAAGAAALYKVPSKVSYTVKKLEQDLGVQLFNKSGRRSVLTPAGQHLLDNGRELLRAAENLTQSTRQVALGWEPTLNIALDSVYDFQSIQELLRDFYAIQPDIDINIHEEVLGGSWEAILNDRVDLVIGAPEPQDKLQGIQLKSIQTVEWVFAVVKGHPLTKIDRVLTVDDISQHRAVIVRDSSRQLPPMSRRVFERQTHLVVSSMAQKIDAQVDGQGVGFLPEFRIRQQLAKGELVVLKTHDPDKTSKLHVAWKKNNKGKALHWFIDRLLLY